MRHGFRFACALLLLVGLLSSQSLVKAVEARMDKDANAIDRATGQGYIMTPYFAEHLPDEGTQSSVLSSAPAFAFPYGPARAALRNKSLHPCHGAKIEYVKANGASVTPTLGAFLQSLPAGFKGAPYRSTDSTVVCVAEGNGTSRIGDRSFDWSARDIFVVPSWYPVAHHATEDSILFSFSDRPAQKALGLWREQPAEVRPD